MSRERKPKVQPKETWKVLVYQRLPIGGKLLREETVDVKPTYETHFWDVTNQQWGRWEDPPAVRRDKSF